jgi:integrase
MKQLGHGQGTVKTIRNRSGEVTGYRAFLPRELSKAPPRCKKPELYQQPIGDLRPSEDDARALLNAAIVQLREGRLLRHGIPLSSYLTDEIKSRLQAAKRDYNDLARASRSVSTWRSIQNRWLKHAEWIDWVPSTIDSRDVQRFVNWLTDDAEGAKGDPLSGTFIRNVVNFIGAGFDRAGIKPNPAKGLDLPPKGKPAVRFLDLQAQIRFFRCSAIELSDRIMVGCGMGAGLRVGELLAMECADVRLDDQDPHLLVRYGGAKHAPTKGRRVRRVELFEPALGFWKLWMRSVPPGQRMVFAGPSGGYRKAWPEQFPAWAPLAQIDRLSSHIMRHTYAVALLSGSWGYEPKSLEFVSQQVGHAELQTTQKYYGAFEAGTWTREVRRMTGRADGWKPGDVVTAETLLGLRAEVSNEASGGGDEPILARTGTDGVAPRHSPKYPEIASKRALFEALTPQTFAGPAVELLALASAGDGRAFDAARTLAQSVLDSPAVRLAQRVLEGGPHALARGIELAEELVRSAVVPDRETEGAVG